jgi:hypothetical protein
VESEYVQPVAACEIEMLVVTVVIVPVRAAPLLAATLIDNGETPGPAPLVTAIQGTLDAAVQAQPPGATTLKSADPPAE